MYIEGPVVMAGLDQALSGLASGQLQAIVVAAQCKLQAVSATGSTSASAALDVAVHDTKILFPPGFPILPDMSDGRFPHPDSALARAQPGFGWLTDITARYLFKRSLCSGNGSRPVPRRPVRPCFRGRQLHCHFPTGTVGKLPASDWAPMKK